MAWAEYYSDFIILGGMVIHGVTTVASSQMLIKRRLKKLELTIKALDVAVNNNVNSIRALISHARIINGRIFETKEENENGRATDRVN